MPLISTSLTVTPPNPTPPTNMSCTGSTPPNPATFAANVYNFPFGNPPGTAPYGQNPSPPPYFDDGWVSGTTDNLATRIVFAAKTAALATGGTSIDGEGKGTEVSVTAPGSRTECPTVACSTNGSYTTTPNASHVSSQAPTTTPTITGLSPVAPVGNGGTTTLIVTGTGYQQNSVILVAGVPVTTQYTSATELRAMNAPKRTSAGNSAITVNTNGTATAATNWVFT